MEIQITPALVTSLTVGEIEFIEEKTGRAINSLFEDGVPKGTVLRSLAYVVRRRGAKEAGEAMPDWEDTFDDRVNVSEDIEEVTANRPSSSGRRKPRGGS